MKKDGDFITGGNRGNRDKIIAGGNLSCIHSSRSPFAPFAPVQDFWLRLRRAVPSRLRVFALIRVPLGLSLRVANPQYRQQPLAARAFARQMPRVELRFAPAVSPQRGGAGLVALATRKSHYRRTPFNFQTGSQSLITFPMTPSLLAFAPALSDLRPPTSALWPPPSGSWTCVSNLVAQKEPKV
jgi:hypothetical protein